MKFFNGEFIIGRDGVISPLPRGNYPDALAIRPQSLLGPAGAKYANELRDEVGKWFQGANIDQMAEDFAKAGQQKLAQIIDLAAESLAVSHLTEGVQKMPGVTQNTLLKACLPSARSQKEMLDRLRSLNIHGIRVVTLPQEKKLLADTGLDIKIIHNEIEHMFGSGLLGQADKAPLSGVKNLAAANLQSNETRAALKALFKSRLAALQRDPVQCLTQAYEAFLRHNKTALDKYAQVPEIYQNIKKVYGETERAFWDGHKALGTVCVAFPQPTLNERASAAPHTRIRATIYGGPVGINVKGIGAGNSPHFPYIEISRHCSRDLLSDVLMEEGCHTLDHFLRLPAPLMERKENIYRDVLQFFAGRTRPKVTPQQFENELLGYAKKSSDLDTYKRDFNTTKRPEMFGALMNTIQLTELQFRTLEARINAYNSSIQAGFKEQDFTGSRGNEVNAARKFTEDFFHKFRGGYNDLTHIVPEITSIVFRHIFLKDEGGKAVNKLILGDLPQLLADAMRIAVKQEIPPGTIEREVMDTLHGIKFIGPKRAIDMGGAFVA